MFKQAWQSIMISLARSSAIKKVMQGERSTSLLVKKYVAGSVPADSISCANALLDEHGIRCSHYYLGEYVDTIELVDLNISNILETARHLVSTNLDFHISIDPTQIGYSISPELANKNAHIIANEVNELLANRSGVHCLMLDMEDSHIVDATINLHNEIMAKNYPVAITLQAYLKRTENDMRAMIKSGSKVRLVKGAFTSDESIAYTSQKEIKKNYYDLVDLMLSKASRELGFYPVIATHDDKVQAHATAKAAENGWKQGEYEFEMLLGVRSDIAYSLSDKGERVRLYVPFGKDWWPYAVRRIGENPRNAILLARSLFN